VYRRKTKAQGSKDTIFARISNCVLREPRLYHSFRYFEMELEGVDRISVAKGLMEIFLSGSEEDCLLREIEGLSVPLKDREKRGEGVQEWITHPFLRQGNFIPPNLLLVAFIDACAQTMGDELCSEAYPDGRLSIANPPPHNFLLFQKEGIPIIIIDAHRSTHEDEEMKGGGVWKAVTVP